MYHTVERSRQGRRIEDVAFGVFKYAGYLQRRYSGGRSPRINKAWLEQLTLSSNSAQGLQLTEEIGALGADEVDADSPPGK